MGKIRLRGGDGPLRAAAGGGRLAPLQSIRRQPHRRPGPARGRGGVPQHTRGQRPAHRRGDAHNAERVRHSAPHGLPDGPDRRRGLRARDHGRREHHDQDPRPALHPRRALGQPERGHQRDKRRPGLQHRHTDGRSRALLPHAPRLDLLRRAHTRLRRRGDRLHEHVRRGRRRARPHPGRGARRRHRHRGQAVHTAQRRAAALRAGGQRGQHRAPGRRLPPRLVEQRRAPPAGHGGRRAAPRWTSARCCRTWTGRPRAGCTAAASPTTCA